MSFKSREDIYTTKTFETTEDAAGFVSVIGQSFKSQGYKITEMSIREGRMGYMDDGDVVYVGTVSAFKEAEDKKEDAPSDADEAPAKVN